ncbi:MAG: sugar ABC transporter permease [Chloroflexi bacterium]|nr:sugar ABC transporter permease [Chloroflexota bacterium]
MATGPNVELGAGLPSVAAPASRFSLSQREALWGYLFISPWLFGFLLFSLIPIGAVIYLSFTEYSVFDTPRWVGLRNYQKIFTGDPLFWTSLYNTVYYVLLAVPGQVIVGFVVALGLNQKIRGLVLLRAAYYLPVLIPYVVSSVLFVWILDPQVGVLRYLLGLVGVPSPQWLQSEQWAKPAIVLLTIWHMGGYMLIYLAGLQGIPQHLYEAADIDGAGSWSKLRNVTIPMLTPTIFFNLIVGIINSFQVFTLAYIMTKGGPLNSTLFYVLYIYRQAFEFFQMGYASALATILFVVVLIVTMAVFHWSRTWVYYEGADPKGVL